MKRKSGLHKRVSSIFGGVSPSDSPSVKTPIANNEVGKAGALSSDISVSETGGHAAKPAYQQHQPPTSELGLKAVVKISPAFTEDQEYAASQRRKLYISVGLFVVLMLVLYFNFYKPGANKKVNADVKTPPQPGIIAKDVEIRWPKPELWTDDIRDPMIRGSKQAHWDQPGSLVLRGIVHQPQGRSQALIGIEILYEGDEIEGWTVKEISADLVKLQNSDGEKLELRMEDR